MERPVPSAFGELRPDGTTIGLQDGSGPVTIHMLACANMCERSDTSTIYVSVDQPRAQGFTLPALCRTALLFKSPLSEAVSVEHT
jgi:hypothetical protein